MIEISVPGVGDIRIEHLVFDFNGTLAVDGKLLPEVRPGLYSLSNLLTLHVVTADTFGLARDELERIPCSLHILPSGEQVEAKRSFVISLGAATVASFGNGRNDSGLLESSRIGVAVIQAEGLAVESLVKADIICNSIHDALDLFLNSKRLIATLRS